MLDFKNYRGRPREFAERFSVSQAAADLCTQSDVIDLHVDSFIWHRAFGYRLEKRHAPSPFMGAFFAQADMPRLLEAGFTGATWVITTNPFRDAEAREQAFLENLEQLRAELGAQANHIEVVTTARGYRHAVNNGRQGAFIGVQGGNALDFRPSRLSQLPEGLLLRVTLVHLTRSSLGGSSTSTGPIKTSPGLGKRAFEFIEYLKASKTFLDLAHAHPTTFWQALDVHGKKSPVWVTHTGVSSVYPHWRNLDDRQLKAIADTGGIVGIMYHAPYLGSPFWRVGVKTVADHVEHAIQVAGENHVAFGSDWDGAIVPPRDMKTCLEFPRLVDELLRRGHSPERLQKLLGKNFLASLSELRD